MNWILKLFFGCALYLSACVVLWNAGDALAATRYWKGGASTDMNNPANWTGAGLPAGDDLIFDGDSSDVDAISSATADPNSITMTDNVDFKVEWPATWAWSVDSGFTADGNDSVVLSNAWTMTGDGNFALEAGPTYVTNSNTLRFSFLGDGTFAFNGGGQLNVDSVYTSATSKTTTIDGSSAVQTNGIGTGDGTLTINSNFFIVPDGRYSVNLNPGLTLNGTSGLTVRAGYNGRIDIPQISYGCTGDMLIYATGGTMPQYYVTGPISFTSAANFSSRKGGTGNFYFDFNGQNLILAGGYIQVGNNNATGTCSYRLGSGSFKTKSIETTTYNAGVCSLFCETSTISDTGSFLMGSNTVIVPGTSTLEFANAATAVCSLSTPTSQHLYDVSQTGAGALTIKTTAGDAQFDGDFDKSGSGAVTLAAGIDVGGDLTVSAGDFDQNGQALKTTGSQTFGGAGTITLDAPDTISGDADFTLESGPTHDCSALSLRTEGTGSVINNSGNSEQVNKFDIAAAGKHTTLDGTSLWRPAYVTLGAGSLSVASAQQFWPSSADAFDFDASHTMLGAGNLDIQIVSGDTVSMPQVNAAGMTGTISISSGTPSACGVSLQGPFSAYRLYAFHGNTGPFLFITNGENLTIGNRSRFGGNNASGSSVFDMGTSVVDIGNLFETTTYNSGATQILADSSHWKITTNFSLGSNTDWIPNADTLTLDGSGPQLITVPAGDTLGHFRLANTGDTTSIANEVAFLSFDVSDGAFDQNGQPMTVTSGGYFDCNGSDALTLDNLFTMGGSSFGVSTSGTVDLAACTLSTSGAVSIDFDVDLTLGELRHTTNSYSTFLGSSTDQLINVGPKAGDIGVNMNSSAQLSIGQALVPYKVDTLAIYAGQFSSYPASGYDTITTYFYMDGGVWSTRQDTCIFLGDFYCDGGDFLVYGDELFKFMGANKTITACPGDTMPHVYMGGDHTWQ